MTRRDELLALAVRLETKLACLPEGLAGQLVRLTLGEDDERLLCFEIGDDPTQSFDAAVALCERVLPAALWSAHCNGKAFITPWSDHAAMERIEGRGKTAALGMCSAIARALAAQESPA